MSDPLSRLINKPPSLREELRFHIDSDNLRVRSDQIRTRIEAYPVMIFSQVVVALGLVWMMWDKVSSFHLLGWLAAMFLALGMDGVFYLKHRQEFHTVEQCRRHARHFLIFVTLIAGLWGAVAFLMFVPGDLGYQALLICVILGLGAAAATINPVYLPALFMWEILVLAPIILRNFLEGDGVHLTLGGMLLLYFGTVLNDGIKLSRVFREALCRRYENDALLEALTHEKTVSEMARERAETANREKSRFLATASHDLRQPLQALVLFSDALRNHREAQSPALQRIATQIENSVGSLMEMFNELLNISRLEAGVIQPRMQDFDLLPVFDRLFVEFQTMAQDKGLHFEVVSSAESLVVYSDPNLVEQVLRNLLSNALRYTERGAVKLDCEPCPSGYRICVRDSGIGIEEKHRQKIFEEFYQADNPQRDRRQGLGLGLAIVRRVEQLLGLRIELESEVGVGSSFCFELQQGDLAGASGAEGCIQSQPSLFGLRVLFLEDDVTIRDVTADLLREWGCEVVVASSLDELMGQTAQLAMSPDVLVTDYRLPHGMTAIDAIQEVRAKWGETLPVVVVTGDTGTSVLQELQSCHAMLLHKPLPPSRLRAVIAQVARADD